MVLLFFYARFGCDGLQEPGLGEQSREADLGAGDRTVFIELKFEPAVFFKQVLEARPGIASTLPPEPGSVMLDTRFVQSARATARRLHAPTARSIPPAREFAMPCTMAFSTRGCSSNWGIKV